MSRGSALWGGKGPPSTLSPCPRCDRRACLDVIFISQLRVASSITKASGRLQELLPSGDFIFFPAHQPQKREPTLQTEAACPSPSWQLVRCSSIIRLIKSSLCLDRRILHCGWCSGGYLQNIVSCCYLWFFSRLWNWSLLFRNGAAWSRLKPHVSTAVLSLLKNRLDTVK